MMALLTTNRLESFYGDFQALFGIDFEIEQGEIVAMIGANGAGKSTFLKTVCGLLNAGPEAIVFDGQPIGGIAPGKIVRRGIAMVPEGRRLFASLSVEENLLMGAYAKRAGPWNLSAVYALFPILKERRSSPATALSGGQQQMAAIGRALMSNPKLLICDELSLGLAPIVVKEIYEALPRICSDGMTVVIVEQDVGVAQKVSGRLYCLQEGRVTLSGASRELTREQISLAYFGV
ncbi:MAG TPA: ABC transporter ATP-binding protein [Burkholderiales bacterium]|nr:ABC transporter ATP-binding protein [Burkholderiales bacterium]